MLTTAHNPPCSVLDPVLPTPDTPHIAWGHLYGSSRGLVIATAQQAHNGLVLLITPDALTASQLEQELLFFTAAEDHTIVTFPDWETLPYDVFSPHEDIISQRLETLYQLSRQNRGVLIVPITTLMQRLPPPSHLEQHSLILNKGQNLDRQQMRNRLVSSGYSKVSQVMAHGEFAIRGSLIDVFPMGSRQPFRIDLFDDEIESIRVFDPEKQTSITKVDHIRLLPAREFPINDEAIKRFRHNYRIAFAGNPNASMIYRQISNRQFSGGIEYYLPLFFDHTQTLFDYLPPNTLCIYSEELEDAASVFYQDIGERYEQRRHDIERPLLSPERLYLKPEQIKKHINELQSIRIQNFEIESANAGNEINYGTCTAPKLIIKPRTSKPAQALTEFLDQHHSRVLFTAESAGRREYLLDTLHGFRLHPRTVKDWQDFLHSDAQLAITIAPLSQGLQIENPNVLIITENQLFGERTRQSRRNKESHRNAEAVIRNLTDLQLHSPVVHEEHGVGRYLGLTNLAVGSVEAEFLTLEYSGGDKLYVPVSSLQLISRYTGAGPENAPLHKLGNDQWQRIKRKAAARVRDIAAELLHIHARRAAKPGLSFSIKDDEYSAFAAAFPFEETADQQRAIDDVLHDMAAKQPMDRVICGDVGFGKTEVAMRATFVAVQSGRQVAILVPTTLLTEQHYQNFRDRFADWPVRIESLSRFRSQKQQTTILRGLAEGLVDIVIGTHKLLQPTIKFKDLGLAVIDEEHRFGVRHKERLKDLRTELNILTLTATPIPRTLNMSLHGLRDLSIIATPPAHRHTIKTFVSQWTNGLIAEAIYREIKRGGQVYFLHNKVATIEKTTQQLRKLLPEAEVQFAHGQMRERELEQVMLDFYHQRFNVLVCTTIIESGIDIPTANTIIINRADKLGLSQLHQIRGRVGRSHHRAYAYLITPPKGAMTADAVKRLEAIESLEDLGMGFTLATHDLEIRGAGELLGDEQSGQIQEIGFTLYNELLERAVKALRAGEIPDLESPLTQGTEVDIGVPALIPNDYVPDVHMRLILYKRIANAEDIEALRELQVEMIDRFGLLPDHARNLFETARLKLLVTPLGIVKVEVSSHSGRLVFDNQPRIDTGKLIQLVQTQARIYKFDGESQLRFTLNMENIERRIDTVLGLVDKLALKQAA
ncbi:MAG: transcription-repair coupling factor [Gammaproteobacteria bacterium]|nr:transcription-repair coupling factor [Gammaproteobacteria bacterium]